MKIFSVRDILPQIPGLLLGRRLRFHFESIPYEVKRLSHKKIANFFAAGANQFLLPGKPLGYPVIAQVEPTNFCNLSCPLCLTTSETASRPKHMLAFEDFRTLIDDVGDYLLLIILWNWGEPFLNPDIFRMIRYAKARNIVVHSSTNGNVLFDEERCEQLVDSGLDSLVFAVDGASQETYARYRQGGSLERILSNLSNVVRMKEMKRSKAPRLIVRTVVMQHNERDLPAIRKLAEERGADFFTLKTVAVHPARGNNAEPDYIPENEQYKRYEYHSRSNKRKEKPFTCMRPWKRITLDALGEIIPCEYDYKSLVSFGNIRSAQSARSVWKGPVAANLREKFHLGDNDLYLCKDCVYKHRVTDDCIIESVGLTGTK